MIRLVATDLDGTLLDSDSRVPPELIFNQSIGALFVAWLVGNWLLDLLGLPMRYRVGDPRLVLSPEGEGDWGDSRQPLILLWQLVVM